MFQYVKRLKPIRGWFLMSFLLTSMFISANALLSNEESGDISTVIAEGIVTTVRAVLPPVEVSFVQPETITLSLRNQVSEILLGTSNRITPTFFPEQTTDKALTWASSDPSIIEVTNGGIAVARALGSATITATSRVDNVIGSIVITVVDLPMAQSFTINAYVLDQPVETIAKDTTAKVRLSNIMPNQASIEAVVFQSNDPNVASINVDGVIYGHQAGSVVISAQIGSFQQSLLLTVNNVAGVILPNALYLDGPSSGEVGRPFQLNVSFGNQIPTDSQVTFKSSHPAIARVNDLGVVMPVNFSGYQSQTTTITVYSQANPSLILSRILTIHKIFPQTLSLSAGANAVVEVGKSLTIQPTFFPLDTTDRQLIYQSNDDRVGTVSSAGDFGTFVGKGQGQVVITARSVMSESIVATMTINVIPATALTPNHIASIYLFVRKGIGHVAFNAINGLFAFLTFYTYLPARKKPFWLTTIMVGITFGIFAESLQIFAVGRAPLIEDAFYNMMGYFLSVGVMMLLLSTSSRRQKNKRLT
jgi:uncharacterized protein YjdB